MSRLQVFTIALFMALSGLCFAGKAGKEVSIPWAHSYEEALRLAQEQNRPIFVAINAEGIALENDASGANEEMAAKVYRDPKLAQCCGQSINLIASAAGHSRKAIQQADGSFRKECTKFPGVTCEEHQEVEKAIRREYFKNAEGIVSPQHLLLQPNGSLIGRREYQAGVKELSKMIQDAATVVGKPRKSAANAQPAAKPAQGAKKTG